MDNILENVAPDLNDAHKYYESINKKYSLKSK
jgi:hypothetical protein